MDARRLASQTQAIELAAVAELARRRFAETAARDTARDTARDAGRDAGREVVEVLSPADYVYDEVAQALTLTTTAADELIRFATELTTRLPGTYAALARGAIDYRKARTIWHSTGHIDDRLAHTIEAAVLPKAPDQTTGQLRAKIRRLVKHLDPQAAERRRVHAEQCRGVELVQTDDGVACLSGVDLPADAAGAAYSRINAIATGLKHHGDTRKINQLRADVYLGLLRGTLTTGQPPTDTTTPPQPTASTPDWNTIDDAIAETIAHLARTQLTTLTHPHPHPHRNPPRHQRPHHPNRGTHQPNPDRTIPRGTVPGHTDHRNRRIRRRRARPPPPRPG